MHQAWARALKASSDYDDGDDSHSDDSDMSDWDVSDDWDGMDSDDGDSEDRFDSSGKRQRLLLGWRVSRHDGHTCRCVTMCYHCTRFACHACI